MHRDHSAAPRGTSRRPGRRLGLRLALAALIAGGVAAPAGLAQAQFQLPERIDGPRLPGGLDGVAPALRCPDPMAEISAEVLVPSTGGSPGRVRIHASVRNNGGPWASRSGQQLAEMVQGAVSLQSIDFPSLDAGRSATFHRDIDWTPHGEFNSDFVLRLVYGPDIFVDGMTSNDDCQLANNQARLTAASIDAMFGA